MASDRREEAVSDKIPAAAFDPVDAADASVGLPYTDASAENIQAFLKDEKKTAKKRVSEFE